MFSLPGKWQHLVALSFIALTSCQTVTVTPVPKATETQAIVYTIKKGQHSSDSPFAIRNVNEIRFEAAFDVSAIYQTIDKANQADINKLYGISDCRTDHHSNSARFGWRWFNNQLEIHAYAYLDKVRHSKLVGVVDLNTTHIYQIRLEENKYIFTLDDESVELPRHCSGKGEGYQLYPYFGGDEVAPHDITIAIQDLK